MFLFNNKGFAHVCENEKTEVLDCFFRSEFLMTKLSEEGIAVGFAAICSSGNLDLFNQFISIERINARLTSEVVSKAFCAACAAECLEIFDRICSIEELRGKLLDQGIMSGYTMAKMQNNSALLERFAALFSPRFAEILGRAACDSDSESYPSSIASSECASPVPGKLVLRPDGHLS